MHKHVHLWLCTSFPGEINGCNGCLTVAVVWYGSVFESVSVSNGMCASFKKSIQGALGFIKLVTVSRHQRTQQNCYILIQERTVAKFNEKNTYSMRSMHHILGIEIVIMNYETYIF